MVRVGNAKSLPPITEEGKNLFLFSLFYEKVSKSSKKLRFILR
jgi:hypothetical protein